MKNSEFEAAITFSLNEVLDYRSNSIVSCNILVEDGCFVQAYALDFGKVQPLEKSAFPRFINIIEGKAEVVIENNSSFLHAGDSIIIPGNSASSIEANEKFKMICTSVHRM